MAKKYLANMDEKAVGIEMFKKMQKRIQRKILNWLKDINGTHSQKFFLIYFPLVFFQTIYYLSLISMSPTLPSVCHSTFDFKIFCQIF